MLTENSAMRARISTQILCLELEIGKAYDSAINIRALQTSAWYQERKMLLVALRRQLDALAEWPRSKRPITGAPGIRGTTGDRIMETAAQIVAIEQAMMRASDSALNVQYGESSLRALVVVRAKVSSAHTSHPPRTRETETHIRQVAVLQAPHNWGAWNFPLDIVSREPRIETAKGTQ